jgi:hypothetical protein
MKPNAEFLEEIYSIAQTYPKNEGVTVEGLMSQHGFTDSNMIHAALEELERQGRLTARPMFAYTGEDEKKAE